MVRARPRAAAFHRATKLKRTLPLDDEPHWTYTGSRLVKHFQNSLLARTQRPWQSSQEGNRDLTFMLLDVFSQVVLTFWVGRLDDFLAVVNLSHTCRTAYRYLSLNKSLWYSLICKGLITVEEPIPAKHLNTFVNFHRNQLVHYHTVCTQDGGSKRVHRCVASGWDKMVRQFEFNSLWPHYYFLAETFPFNDAKSTVNGHSYSTPIREPGVFAMSMRDLQKETIAQSKKDMRIWCGQFHHVAHGLRMYLEGRLIAFKHVLNRMPWDEILESLPEENSVFTFPGARPGMYKYKDTLIPVSKYDFYPGNFEEWISFLERIYTSQFTEEDRDRLGPLAFCVTVYSHVEGHRVHSYFQYKSTVVQY